MPHVIVISGPSGAGKSTTVGHLLEFADKGFRPRLMGKFTTRDQRATDVIVDSAKLDPDKYGVVEQLEIVKQKGQENLPCCSHELIFVKSIPGQCDLVYEHCGERYGLKLESLFAAVAKGHTPIIILNDIRAVEDVRTAFRGLVRSVFIHRKSPSLEQFKELAQEREIEDKEEPGRRCLKAEAIYRIYIENIHLFDHVIINSSDGYKDLDTQVRQIIKGLRQDPNWPLC